jgi:hypothetical protein
METITVTRGEEPHLGVKCRRLQYGCQFGRYLRIRTGSRNSKFAVISKPNKIRSEWAPVPQFENWLPDMDSNHEDIDAFVVCNLLIKQTPKIPKILELGLVGTSSYTGHGTVPPCEDSFRTQ